MKRIAFIGTGVMGGPMAINLLKAGFGVGVYTRTKEKAREAVSKGAVWHDDIPSCVEDAEAVITMVGYPKDVEEVYFGAGGIIENAPAGAYLIDMTTTSPALSRRIYDAAKKRGLHALDAPVSGGDIGANNATLSIMAGGDEEDFKACGEIFSALGKTAVYQGGAGSGQHTKMANQIAIAGTIAAVCEAITYAKAAGLSAESVLSSIGGGAAGSFQMTNMGPKMLSGDFGPGFYLKHFIKDMRIAAEESKKNGAELGVLKYVLSMYERLSDEGMDDMGTQALIKYYE
ncbi:MAG: NAD(P)-dependent oxidoreductase [Clostridia bacterium]|nr:NAD(P)-dependent oxidoreductase [Clostridia bacterium]